MKEFAGRGRRSPERRGAPGRGVSERRLLGVMQRKDILPRARIGSISLPGAGEPRPTVQSWES